MAKQNTPPTYTASKVVKNVFINTPEIRKQRILKHLKSACERMEQKIDVMSYFINN